MKALNSCLVIGAAFLLAACSTVPGNSATDADASLPVAPADRSVGVKGVDWASHMQACLADAGWEVEVTRDGGVSLEVPPEQSGSYDAASESCIESWEEVYPQPELTDELLRELYAAELTARECLIREGYPASEPISEAVYVAEYQANGGPSWIAYGVVQQANVAQEEWFRINEVCPQAGEQVLGVAGGFPAR